MFAARKAGERLIARAIAGKDDRWSRSETEQAAVRCRVKRIVKLVSILFGYAMAIAGLSIALFAPLFWLLTPDPTLGLEPRVAPLPPRIAESIERKRAPAVARPERVAPTTAFVSD